MDISKASNFERFVFDLVGRDADALKALWRRVETEGRFDLSGSPLFGEISTRFGFASGRCSHAECVAAIRDVHAATGIVIDPHTAVAAKVARDHAVEGVPMIVLETAKPAKFAGTIREALDLEATVPAGFEDLMRRPQRSVALPADTDAIKRYVAANS